MTQQRIGHGSWGDYAWSVLVEPDGDAQFLMADLHRGDGRRRTSGMGGPIATADRPLNIYAGRADGFPITVLARSDRGTDLAISVNGAFDEAVWTHLLDGVSYLFHLLPETRVRPTVEVVGRMESGEVSELARLP